MLRWRPLIGESTCCCMHFKAVNPDSPNGPKRQHLSAFVLPPHRSHRSYQRGETNAEIRTSESTNSQSCTYGVASFRLRALKTIVAENMGRQILTLGGRKSVQEFLDIVDEVTPQSIAATAENIISSPLTMAPYGNANL